MKIGSHNSLSYIKPKKWYLMPFHFMARCQSKDYVKQYETYGVRLFDVRIWFDKYGKPEVRHGLMAFDIDSDGLNDFFEYLNNKGDCYCRILLEEDNVLKKNKNIEEIENKFSEFCKKIEDRYKYIAFFGGNRKYDFKVIYKFRVEYPNMVDYYSSTTSWFTHSNSTFLRIIDDWWPWLYARFHNKKNIEKVKKENKFDFLLLDFVNIR